MSQKQMLKKVSLGKYPVHADKVTDQANGSMGMMGSIVMHLLYCSMAVIPAALHILKTKTKRVLVRKGLFIAAIIELISRK